MDKAQIEILARVARVGDECQNCKASNHTGVWDGERFIVCFVCGDMGMLDEKAIEILNFYADQC